MLVVDGREVAPLEVAASRRACGRGLLGREGLDGALWLPRVRSVHTVGMRFAIDVAWIDGGGVVRRVVPLPPGRLSGWHRAAGVLEAEAGAFARWDLHVGGRVSFGARHHPTHHTGGVTDEGAGALVLVATPIGNLGDLAPRAVEELARADLLCCEDTRRTGLLLAHVGIAAPPLRRVDAHTEADAASDVVERVARGERVALVTDAGTPGISDPGTAVVQAVVAAGLRVEVVPGPVAAVAAVVLSGFATARVALDGFLPRRGPERAARLAELAVERRTVALYEAPARVAATLADIASTCGADRPVAVVRELTKLHEEVWRGTAAEGARWATAEPVRGEVVIVVGPAATVDNGDSDDAVRAALRAARAQGLSPGRAAAEVAAALGRPRREVYALALEDDG